MRCEYQDLLHGGCSHVLDVLVGCLQAFVPQDIVLPEVCHGHVVAVFSERFLTLLVRRARGFARSLCYAEVEWAQNGSVALGSSSTAENVCWVRSSGLRFLTTKWLVSCVCCCCLPSGGAQKILRTLSTGI